MHQDYMKRALELAELAEQRGEGRPFGCIIVRDGIILAEAGNRALLKSDPTAHAEIEAIRDACSSLQSLRLDGCDVYASGQPCPMCLAALYWVGARTIYYANPAAHAAAIHPSLSDRFIRDALRMEDNQRPIPEIHLRIRDH